MARLKTLAGFGLLVVVWVSSSAVPVLAQDATKAEALVDKARLSFGDLAADPNLTWLRDNLKKAKGLLLVPEQFKAGFIGSARHVMLALHRRLPGSRQVVVADEQLDGTDVVGELLRERQGLTHQTGNALP